MSFQATPPPRRSKLPWAATAVVLWLLAHPGLAQFRQFSEPGELAERETPTRDALRQRLADAPWRAGRWRLQPRLAVGDLVYTNNVFDESDVDRQQEDVRALATAGLDAYLPLGGQGVLAAFAHPSYSWWRTNADLRRFNLSYGAALFGYFNRLSTQLSAKREESERTVNNELRIPAAIRRDSLTLEARLSVRGPWQIFADGTTSESRYPNAEDLVERAPQLALLARDEEVLSAGLAYDIPNRFNLGIGWRRVESTFVDDPEGRSNRGRYPFLSLTVPGNKLTLDADFGQRRLEFDRPSERPESKEAVGTVRASLDLGVRTTLTAYGARDVVYSALDAGGFFTSARTGLALGWGDSEALRLGLFAESGRDEFTTVGGDNPGRIDDTTTYGLTLDVPLRWGLFLKLGLADLEVDSNFDQFDRSRTQVTSSVSLALPEFPF